MIGKAINLKVKAKPYLYPKFVEYFIQKKKLLYNIEDQKCKRYIYSVMTKQIPVFSSPRLRNGP